jgi:hypothetical protein
VVHGAKESRSSVSSQGRKHCSHDMMKIADPRVVSCGEHRSRPDGHGNMPACIQVYTSLAAVEWGSLSVRKRVTAVMMMHT